jgi:hypothetical protein
MSGVKSRGIAPRRRLVDELVTSSTSFANPAVTVGRIFSDTFAGTAPTSALFFIAAQLVGGLVGLGLVRFFFPDAPVTAGRAVVPHPNHLSEES